MKARNNLQCETPEFRDFREMVENVAKKYPDRIAISFKKDPHDTQTVNVTYSEARDFIRNIGTELISLGCRDRKVALIGESSYEWVCTYFSLMSIGSIVVPIDKDLPIEETADIMNFAECEFVIYSLAIEEKIDKIMAKVLSLKVCICMGDAKFEGALKLYDIAERGKEKFLKGDNSYYDYEIDPERLATIVFTSGTTGKGKGVMLSQKNIASDVVLGMNTIKVTTKTMSVLPPHHTYCSSIVFVGHYCQGSTIFICSGLKHIMNEMKEQQPQHLILVPLFVETMYKKIWSTAEKNGKADMLRRMLKISNFLRKCGIDLRRRIFKSVLASFGGKLELIICGGASLNQEIIDFFDSIGVTMLNGYGITECSPLVACNRNDYQKKGSVGAPIIDVKVKIRNPDENGEGEICVKGPNVMLGYYKDPEATKAAFDEEGYFRTGDYGKLDDEGWLYITGRIKNIIILSNGKNVYPEEIESEILKIYGVSEVVVYAGESKSQNNKEVIVAEIFPDYEALSLRGIQDAQAYFNDEIKKLNRRMAPHKAIKMVRIRKEEFQKNTSRKILRFAINKNID